MLNWLLSLSIRWKLQLGFFVVTMITTIYNRMLASHELGKLIDIAKADNVSAQIIQELEANHSAYIFNSFWESGIEFALQFVVIGILASRFVKPIRALCDALKAVEQGDLTKGVPNTSHDEIGQLERHFNSMLARFSQIMRDIEDNAKRMGQAAYQIATISQEISKTSHQEQHRSQEVSSATIELHAISETVQQRANDANTRAKQTEHRARQGIGKIQTNISQMEHTAQEVNRASDEVVELGEAADRIHRIISTIQTIAGQTDLLALNAAIESARAGEQGRGFAVVADEVRKLADRTSNSAQEITEIVSTLTDKVKQVTASMNKVVEQVHSNQTEAGETAEIIDAMALDVSQTSDGNTEILVATKSQLSQLELLRTTVDNLFATLDTSSTKVDTTANIGTGLTTLTENFHAMMSGFTFDRKPLLVPSQNEKRAYPRAQNSLLVRAAQGQTSLEGISLDVSLSGIRLLLSDKLDMNSNISLEIMLPHEDAARYQAQAPLCISGQIAWERSEGAEYLYGIQFNPPSEAQKKLIRHCFDFFNLNAEFS